MAFGARLFGAYNSTNNQIIYFTVQNEQRKI